MDYDYYNRVHPGAYAYYPRVGPSVPNTAPPLAPPLVRAPPSSAPSAGSGIRVQIKPEYQIPPPPPLTPAATEVPRCTFQFDFEFERKILAEAEKERSNWSSIAAEQHPPTAGPSNSPIPGPPFDPVVDKYIKLGLPREAVSIAVLNYGDNNGKVREFVKGFNLLREMGFPSKSVGETLAMFDNDTDKALAHLLNSNC